jgi:hypothetical protein
MYHETPALLLFHSTSNNAVVQLQVLTQSDITNCSAPVIKVILPSNYFWLPVQNICS